uniref:F-box domain-containing protein n=1 Tax=Panagrellus redivivus TaxID=6233 RepID=A0A7E4W3B8_PANRE
MLGPPSLYPPLNAMKLPKPQLPNHLIRELMHIIRLKNDGEAMTRFAVSGKEALPVFTYVIENYTFAVTKRNDIFIRCSAPFKPPGTVSLQFLTEGSKCLAIPFVRDLRVMRMSDTQMPFGKIVQLHVNCYTRSFTSIVNSWTDIEVLKINSNSLDFLDSVIKGSILLTNLRSLEVRLSFEECFEFMTPSIHFLLPEDVTFNIAVTTDILYDVDLLSTIPQVKHLVINVLLHMGRIPLTLRQISSIMQCFTGLETVKLNFTYNHWSHPNDFADVVNFHDELQNIKFPFPVEMGFLEDVDIGLVENAEPIYEQLKSIGYKEDGADYRFVMNKEYDNVKLTYRIEHYDSFESVELTADEIQLFIEDRAVYSP